MRVTYRTRGVKEYWTARWSDIPADRPMENLSAYPLKYAVMTVTANDGRILEAGCGAGRLLRYYHERGFDIVGIDFIDGAIEKLRTIDPSLKAEVGDITALRFPDGTFKYVLAFGLYHNLESGLDQAISETARVLSPGGVVCASFRADNFQTRITDWMSDRAKRKVGGSAGRVFHKLNLTRGEFGKLFTRAGMTVLAMFPVENMPFLYKFRIFRERAHKAFDESKARAEGYRLSWLGQKLQDCLMRTMPSQFCNVYVLIARRDGR